MPATTSSNTGLFMVARRTAPIGPICAPRPCDKCRLVGGCATVAPLAPAAGARCLAACQGWQAGGL
eukprot:2119444-Alexandrium_andersonii.AAC.1